MNAIIAAAGRGIRVEAGAPKPVLGVGQESLIFYSIRSLVEVGCRRFEVVCNEDNLNIIRSYLMARFPNLTFGFPVQRVINGTAGAVALGLERIDGPCFVSWSDMLVRLPVEKWRGNVIFVTGVDQSQSHRYERVVFDESGRVLEIAHRNKDLLSVRPFFATVGVFHVEDAKEILTSAKRAQSDRSELKEIPFEELLRGEIRAGVEFKARSVVDFVDFGVRSSYESNKEMFGGLI